MMIQSNRIKVGVPLYFCRTKIHKSLCPCLPSGSKHPALGALRSPPPQAKHFPEPRNRSPSPSAPSPPPQGSSHPKPKLSRIRTQVRPSPCSATACAAPRPLASLPPIPQRPEGYPSAASQTSLRTLTDIPHGGSPRARSAMRSSSPQFSALGRNSCPKTGRYASR